MTTPNPASAAVFEAALTRRLPATLEFLRQLVGINSFTVNAEGIDQNAARIIEQFAPLGWTAHQRPCAAPGTGSHLILDSGGDGPVVACVSHLDTVYPPEEEISNDFKWRPEGERIYGPGTIDIKGGTALLWMMFDALAEVAPELLRSTRWILVWNACEEQLAPDFLDVCLEALPPATRACLVFEMGAFERDTNGVKFDLVRARKGSGHFRVRVAGRAAHSGGNYAEGANAIHQLARVIDRLMALTDLERGTTVNAGIVSGGTVTNRVPHEAEAELEVRASDPDHYAQVKANILAMNGAGDVTAVSDGFPCHIEITLEKENELWPDNKGTQELLEIWRQAGNENGDTVNGISRGGLSDANRLWHHFPTLDGLGPAGGNLHVSERSADGTKLPEYLLPASLVPKALLNCLALQKLLGDKI